MPLNTSALSGANIVVLRQGTLDVQTTLGNLQSFLSGVAPAVPGAPGAPVQGNTTNSAIALTWAPPSTGGAVANYILQQSAAGSGNWSVAASLVSPSALISGLSASTGYDFRVAAVNGGGTGPYSALLSNALTAATLAAPNSVSSLAASGATSSSLTLSWVESGGAPTTRSVVQRTPSGSGAYAASAGSFGATGGTVTGLSAASSYDFQVVESNAAGSSAPAILTNVLTTAVLAVPGQVTGLTLGTATSSTMPLSWTAPSSGGATASYKVEYRVTSVAGAFTALNGVTGTATTLSGLSASTGYDVRVTAVNTAGNGTASVIVAGTTAVAPASSSYPAVPAGIARVAAFDANAGLTLNGSNLVTALADQSGNGNNLSGAGTGITVVPLSQNGLPGINMTGTNAGLAAPVGAAWLAKMQGDSTIAYVFKSAYNGGSVARLFAFDEVTSRSAGDYFAYVNSSTTTPAMTAYRRATSNGAGTGLGVYTTASQLTKVIIRWNSAANSGAGEMAIWYNGTKTTASGSFVPTITAFARFILGQTTDNTTNNGLNGLFYEAQFYQGAMSDADVGTLVSYMTGKWGS